MLGLLLLAIAPSLLFLLYIYRKDCYEPEPPRLLAWVFFLGALACIPAGILELPFPEGVTSSALAAPVVEEGLKFLVVYLAMYRHPEFDEPMDGIVYATAAGLGFATLENILYVLEGGIAVGIVRAIASVPGHVVFSCLWGFALGTAKFRPRQDRTGIILSGLLGAMLLHGIFNFSLEVFEVFGLILILVVVLPLGWWMTSRNIRTAHADPASAFSGQKREVMMAETARPEPPAADAREIIADMPVHRICTNCGSPLPQGVRFCEYCGKKS